MNLYLLAKKREEKGYSQQQIAEKLGYKNKASYSLIENGKTKVNIELANKLCEILQLSNKDIIEIFFENKVHENQTY